jgi:hypothetical protein
MQTQSLPFSTLKVLVNATREGLKREWIDLSAPSHPMLVSGACVTGGDSFKKLVEQMKSGGLDQDDSDDKTFKYGLVSSGGVKRKIGEGEEQHTIPVQGSCTLHAEAVKLLSSYAKGVRQSLQARFVDINDLSLFDVLHPSRVSKSEEPTFDDFGVQQVRGLLEIYGKDISKGGHRYPALLSDSTLPQYQVYKKLVWERGWGGGGKSGEDVYEVIIMDDSLRKLLPDLVILIEIEGVQWLETATCERGFSLRTQILTAQRHSMGDSLLACLMMICSNGPSLHQKEEVEKFLLAVVARFMLKAFKKRVPSKTCGDKRPQRASASKAKSSVLSQLSGLENVVFNDFIDDELDSEDVSEQRASASMPDSVPIESEEERAAREADEMAALDSVGDYEADPNVMLEDVPQDIVIKTLCVCVCACTRRRYVLVRICICIF